MKLHSIETKRKHPRRVGHGGKRGTTSGRGQKGQKSRSGHVIRPAIRDILLRIPKKRGFRNKPTSDVIAEVNMSRIIAKSAVVIGKDGVITIELLKAAKLLPKRHAGAVKIISLKGDKLPELKATLGPRIKASAKALTAFQKESKKAAK
jgi:large subunit ribosomal protein L15